MWHEHDLDHDVDESRWPVPPAQSERDVLDQVHELGEIVGGMILATVMVVSTLVVGALMILLFLWAVI